MEIIVAVAGIFISLINFRIVQAKQKELIEKNRVIEKLKNNKREINIKNDELTRKCIDLEQKIEDSHKLNSKSKYELRGLVEENKNLRILLKIDKDKHNLHCQN